MTRHARLYLSRAKRHTHTQNEADETVRRRVFGPLCGVWPMQRGGAGIDLVNNWKLSQKLSKL